MFHRNCPSCGNTLSYTTKGNMKAAETKQSICGSCAITKKWEDQVYREKSSAARKGPKSEAFRRNLSKKNSGTGNPMYGRNVQTIWTDKYGNDVADEKNEETWCGHKQTRIRDG